MVDGRSSSNTLARDRPAPSAPCSPPAALLDSRQNSQPKISSGRPRISSQLSTSEPKLVPDVDAEMVTPLSCSSVSSVSLACGGMTTV